MKLDAKALWSIREGGLDLHVDMLKRVEDERLKQLILLWSLSKGLLNEVDQELKALAEQDGWASKPDAFAEYLPEDLD